MFIVLNAEQRTENIKTEDSATKIVNLNFLHTTTSL